MKRLVSLLLALSLVLALTACGSKADGAADAAAGSPPRDSAPAEESAGDPVELIVFAAASMTETLTEIAELYKTAAPEVTITYNFDSPASCSPRSRRAQTATCSSPPLPRR